MPARSALAGALLIGSTLAAGGAFAQDTGFYVGGSLGPSTFKEFCTGGPTVLTCDDKDMGWKLFGGYRFNRHLAIEGTYIDWGEVSGTVTFPTTRVVPLSQTGIGIAAVGSLPLGPQFSLFGKFGLFRTEQELPAATTVRSREDQETQIGFGGKFALGPNWSARAEWERMTESKVEMLSIGLEYRF